MSSRRTILVVGGASGVGKSTVLKALADHPQLNTGDFFKKTMKIADRDAIKGKNWVDVEEEVADDLGHTLAESIAKNSVTIIDTHFSAKVHNQSYRIGLRRDLIYDTMARAFGVAKDANLALRVAVVLVYCDAYSLLDRRRLDNTRKRELFPADCVKALRENSRCSAFYLRETAQARNDAIFGELHSVELVRVENADLRKARRAIRQIAE